MYDYIKGILSELTPTSCTIEAGGVGYLLNISLTTYAYLEPHQGKDNTKVFAHLIVREDEHLLFGFSDKMERELFKLLISVSGVGANTARTILSSYTPAELAQIIESDNSNAIKKVKGVGPKTAQKIVIDLKDKMKSLAAESNGALPLSTASSPSSQVKNEAVIALTMLGYVQSAAEKVVTEIIKGEPSIPVEKLIKEALRKL